MWFALALFAVSFILVALLSPKVKVENARASELGDFQFPRASEGDPVPLIYGTVKSKSPNTIGAFNFKAVPIKKKQKTGLFSSKRVTVGYKYYIGLNLAWALGPGVTLKGIWFDKEKIWEGSQSAAGSFGVDDPDLWGGEEQQGGIGGTIAFYPGEYNQDQDPYLLTHIGPNAPAYVGIAHMVFRDFYWGNSTSIKPVHAELQCFTNSLALTGGRNIMPNGLDMNPIEILFDLYVKDWGRLGTNPALIDQVNWREAAYVLYDENNGMSLDISKPNQGKDLTTEIIRQINAIVYQDPETGKIKIKLIRRDYDVAELPVLSPSEVKKVTNYSKNFWSDTYNQVRVPYINRANEYSKSAAVAQDFANINMQQRVRSTDVGMPGVYDADLANVIAARELAEINIPLYQCELEINRTVATLRPGDPFVLYWPEYGVQQMVLRIRKFNFGQLKSGKIIAHCVQDEFASDLTVLKSPTATDWVRSGVPAEIGAMVVFAAPTFIRDNSGVEVEDTQNLVVALPREPTGNVSNYKVSLDDGVESLVGIAEGNYQGFAQLNADYLATVGFDAGYDSGGTGIVIKTLDPAAEPATVADADIRAGANFLLIGGEILAYRVATALGGGLWRLTHVRRGLLDTAIADHAANATVVFISGGEGITESPVGTSDEIDVKVQNRHGAKLSLGLTASIDVDSRAQRPAPPDYVTLDGIRTPGVFVVAGLGEYDLAWRARTRLDTEVAFEDDAADVAEAGTDYVIKHRFGGGAFEADVIAAASPQLFDLNSHDGDLVEFFVYARRDGLLSLTPSYNSFTLSGGGSPYTGYDHGDGVHGVDDETDWDTGY